MIPVYNCISFLPEALMSVLAQDYGAEVMQIEVIDDCSTDGDVEALVANIGKGRVKYFRQDTNTGSLRNFETAINRATGKYIHLLHGDDKIRPGFYKTMQQLLDSSEQIGAAFCASIYINEKSEEIDRQTLVAHNHGVLKNALILLGESQKVETPSMVVKRSVYEKLGAFRAVIYGEDWDMWIRIAHQYQIAFCPEYLAEYRRHSSSISADKIKKADNIRDLEKIIRLTSEYFPRDLRTSIHKKAKYNYGWFAIITANEFWYQHNNANAAKAQLRAAIRVSKSPGILLAAAKLYIKVLLDIDKPKH